ncbi:ankyrin repeat-containing domain protein [Xylariales sp. AK1849]|nr:ankyrin repeat-containing domain protein [Xylariales sp. AK1849]
MADPLTILGGIASIGQITGLVISTITVISTFCERVHDAPVEFSRVKHRVFAIKEMVQTFEAFVLNAPGFPDEDILPQDLRQQLISSMNVLREDIEEINQHIASASTHNFQPLRRRMKWALCKRNFMTRKLDCLKQSESSLSNILLLLVCRCALLQLCIGTRRPGASSTSRDDVANPPSQDTLSSFHCFVLGADQWLRAKGFYGSYTSTSSTRGGWSSRVTFGINLPQWIWARSVLMDIRFASLPDGLSGFRISSGHVSIQNRVPLESPFMRACRAGDLGYMRQHLQQMPWSVGNRTVCLGKTPLMLAIEGERVDAMKLLLEKGADPNVGDDDQVLPVFSVMGMRPRPDASLIQYPPRWDSWIEALRVLVNCHASVHEVVHNKSMGMLNIHYRPECDRTMDYFCLLDEQSYMDFAAVDSGGWSALVSAIRSRDQGLRAVKFLKKANVNFEKIMNDGRSYLHLAAEMAQDVSILEYIYLNGCQQHINRQDCWGWTPLHYSIMSQSATRFGSRGMDNTRYLLAAGADPLILGKESPFVPYELIGSYAFTASELAKAVRPKLFNALVNAIQNQQR